MSLIINRMYAYSMEENQFTDHRKKVARQHALQLGTCFNFNSYVTSMMPDKVNRKRIMNDINELELLQPTIFKHVLMHLNLPAVITKAKQNHDTKLLYFLNTKGLIDTEK